MSEVQEIKFAIVTATYWKLDGSTKEHLREALLSIASQTYTHYKVFLIGDDYEQEEELCELSDIIDDDKMYLENLPVAVERVKYSGRSLWACGGVNAYNTGIKKALSEGYDYICHLDHDDVMFPDHLDTLARAIRDTKTNFLTTKCNFYPEIETDKLYTPYRPRAGRVFKTGICYNHNHFNIIYREPEEIKKIYGYIYAADADLWNQISTLMEERGEDGIFINKRTCRKIGGKVPILKPEIVKKDG